MCVDANKGTKSSSTKTIIMTAESHPVSLSIERKPSLSEKYLKQLSLPLPWYDFVELNPKTVHQEKPLRCAWIVINVIGLAAFSG